MKIVKIISLSLFMASLLSPITESENTTLSHGKVIKTADGGQLTLLTTKYYQDRATEILLTKTNAQGNEEWYKFYGGRAYDIAGDFIETEDGGFAIIGSTSSYGNGNYNVYLIKVDNKGKEEWSEAYGGFPNEYGISISERADGGYRLVGSYQLYQENLTNEEYDERKWVILTDKRGKALRSTPYRRY
ncbi:MAG: hypothetical protein Roseis2KO_28460 [Roseivirga sp.]